MRVPLVVYHATEDYFGPSGQRLGYDDTTRQLLKGMLGRCGLLVAVSENIRRNYLNRGEFRGVSITAPNGCDFDFWLSSKAYEFEPVRESNPIVFYQGGINARLDFRLILELVELRPRYEFWFCGDDSHATEPWRQIISMSNVRYLGQVAPEIVAHYSKSASVGIIPYLQEPIIKNSLPLKAYEYVACGMPVVTVPIDALSGRPDLFAVSRTAKEFAESIDVASQLRNEPGAIQRRLEAAREMSYDLRFEEVCHAIGKTIRNRSFAQAM